MDEKLQELLYQMQRTAAQVGNVMGSAAISVNQWATDIIRSGKARAQILDLKTEVGVRLREIGELVYGTHIGEPSDSEILFAKLGQIDVLRGRIAELERQLEETREEEPVEAEAVPVCENCGQAAQADDRFCRGCGARL